MDGVEHRVACGSIFDEAAIRVLMRGERASVLYSDPPWGPGNLGYWGTHAGIAQAGDWPAFVERFAAVVRTHVAEGAPIFVEMGLRWADQIAAALGRPTCRWITRYRSGGRLLPCVLLYAGPALPEAFDPSDLRGAALPRACIAATGLRAGTLLDPCCGKGYSARAALAHGLSFRGLELNAARLEVTRRWLTKSRS